MQVTLGKRAIVCLVKVERQLTVFIEVAIKQNIFYREQLSQLTLVSFFSLSVSRECMAQYTVLT